MYASPYVSSDMIPPAVHEVTRTMQTQFPYFILVPKEYWRFDDGVYECRFEFAHRIQPELRDDLFIQVGTHTPVRTDADLKAQLEEKLTHALQRSQPNPRQLAQIKHQHPEWWQN